MIEINDTMVKMEGTGIDLVGEIVKGSFSLYQKIREDNPELSIQGFMEDIINNMEVLSLTEAGMDFDEAIETLGLNEHTEES